jgi:hypothetical protein
MSHDFPRRLPSLFLALIVAGILTVPAIAGSFPDIYEDARVTELGCSCKSECTTSLAFNCFSQAVCEVHEKKCLRGEATWSWSKMGWYDFCTFERPFDQYERRAASEKARIVWSHVKSDTRTASFPSASGVAGIFTESVRLSFQAAADVFPSGTRKKLIHSVGVVGGIRFVPDDGAQRYGLTGLFAGDGAEHGLIRLSSATAPSASGGFVPGGAIKLFRTGVPSANFVAMPSLDPTPCSSPDFFARDFVTAIPTPARKDLGGELLKRKFWQASFCPLQVGVSDLAAFDQEGARVSEPRAPYSLRLSPSASVRGRVLMDCNDYAGTLERFQSIDAGTTLFDVHACMSPSSCSGDGDGVRVGSVVLSQRFTTSRFGDESLFFRHQWKERDFELRPDWLHGLDLKRECGMSCASAEPPSAKDGCSNPFDAQGECRADAAVKPSASTLAMAQVLKLAACPLGALGVDDAGGDKVDDPGCPYARMWRSATDAVE